MHGNPDNPVPFAGLAATTLDIKAETADLVSPALDSGRRASSSRIGVNTPV